MELFFTIPLYIVSASSILILLGMTINTDDVKINIHH